jgi:hypothetical protein
MKYKLLKVRGYWNDELLKSKGYLKDYSDIEQDVNIALDKWDNNEECEDDMQIFYYYDLEYEEKQNIEVGDIISDGFVITKVY